MTSASTEGGNIALSEYLGPFRTWGDKVHDMLQRKVAKSAKRYLIFVIGERRRWQITRYKRYFKAKGKRRLNSITFFGLE